MSEPEKEKEALAACPVEITEEVLVAKRKYRELVETPEIKMYNAAKALVDNMRDFLGNVDMNERDPVSTKPIHDIKKLQDSVKNLGPMLKELENLREQAFRSIDNSNIRGGQQKGYLD